MKFQQTALNLAMIMALGASITACGGGGSSGDNSTNNNGGNETVSSDVTIKVQAQDALGDSLNNKTVCVDLNANGVCDPNEAQAVVQNGYATLKVNPVSPNSSASGDAEEELSDVSIIVMNGSQTYVRHLDGGIKFYEGRTLVVNPVSTIISQHAKDNAQTYADSLQKVSNVIGCSSAEMQAPLKKDSALSVFANALEQNNKLNTQFDDSAVTDAVKNIDEGIQGGMTFEQVTEYFKKHESFDGIKDAQKINTKPTVDGIDASSVSCNTGTFKAVNPVDADGDELKVCWDFGDNSDSVCGKEVTHKFVNAQKRTVKVTVSDEVSSVEDRIEFSPDNTTCVTNFSVAFNYSMLDSASGKVKFVPVIGDDGDVDHLVWDFGDGVKDTSSLSPVHDYAIGSVAKTYTVNLTVYDSNGFEHKAQPQKVTIAPLVVDNTPPSVSGTAVLNNGVLTYKSTSTDVDKDPLTCTWDFGDGTSSTDCEGTHTYTRNGDYTVKLSVSDGNNTPVSKEINKVKVNIVIGDDNNPPVVSGIATIKNNQLTFNSTSTDADGDNLTYKWDFGDGSTGSTQKSGTYNYTKSGTYAVKLTVSDGKATVSKVINDSVKPCGTNCGGGTNNPPTADFHYKFTGLAGKLTGIGTDPDKDDKLSYSWEAEGATFSSANVQSPTVTFKEGGKKTVTLTVSDGKASVTKSYSFTLKEAISTKPTKRGIYFKGDAKYVYIWDDNKNMLTGSWPGATMQPASEAGWMFYDSSAISASKINVIFSKDGNVKLTGDLTNSPVVGCYDGSSWTEFDACNLSDSGDEEVVEGGADIPEVITNFVNEIPWNKLDYASYTSEATGINVESAPYVQPNLAPGAYHEAKTVELNLEDADRNSTSGRIYYTLDNTQPTESSQEYTGPITLEDTSTDGLGTAYRLRTLVVGDNGMKQEQHFFWFIKTTATPVTNVDFRDETIYFVVTARYFDGDESNNYFCRDRFDPTDPSWRGDFKGLIEKLDYIKDMGFTAIWVTPPVENRSGLDYHGYHAYDWFQPDLRLESKGATYFDFIKAAHKKGIKVIQDVVLNHSSNYGIRGQAWIEKIPTKYYIEEGKKKGWVDMGPYQGNIGDYASEGRCDNDNPVAPAWHRALCAGDPNANATFTVKFKNRAASVTGSQTPKGDAEYYWAPEKAGYLPEKWYHVGYTNNWESVEEVQQRSMAGDCVDLKTESPNVRNYMNAAMSMYIDMGIDAVRIDTLKHMPREDVISMVSTWKKKKPDLFVYGEALIKGFGDNTPDQLLPWYYTRTGSGSAKEGDSGVSVLDFSLMSTFRDNVTKGSVGGLDSVFTRFDGDYADATKLVTFFQNHDLTPDNSWSGNGAQHCCTDRKNSALAYNVLWTVRGIPVMYAGDETGARVGLPPDLVDATGLVSKTGRLYIGDTLVPGTDPIQGHITDLNAIRKSSKALQRGVLKVLNGDPLIFERQYEGERAIVAIPGAGGGSANVSGATDGTYTDLVTGAKFTVSGGSVALGNIPGGSMRVLVKDYTGGKVAGKSEFLK